MILKIYVTILTLNIAHKVVVDHYKNTRLLDASSGKGKSTSKYNNYFCFISKIQLVGKICRNHANDL